MTQINSNARVEAFLAKHQMIRALPENAAQIIRALSDSNSDFADLVKLIEKDAAIVGAIMKTVNSAFYALPAKITRLDHAVAYLGMKTVKEVITSSCLSKMCKPAQFGKYDARDLWDHSIAVATIARELAARSGKFDAEEAFLLGVLHDMGLMLAAQSEISQGKELLTRAESGEVSFAETEVRVFGFNHWELGAALARKWEFPESHVMAIQGHHSPDDGPDEFRAICNHLFVADTLACTTEIGCPLSARGQVVNEGHLESAGIDSAMIEEVMGKVGILVRLHLG